MQCDYEMSLPFIPEVYECNMCCRNLSSPSYHKVPKFSDTRKLYCNLRKIQTNRPNLRVSRQKDENGIANSEDSDQTAPLGAL